MADAENFKTEPYHLTLGGLRPVKQPFPHGTSFVQMAEGLLFKKVLAGATLQLANTGSATDHVLAGSDDDLTYFTESDVFAVATKSDNLKTARLIGWLVMVDFNKLSPDTDKQALISKLLAYSSSNGRSSAYDPDDPAMAVINVLSRVIAEGANQLTMPYAGPYFIPEFSAPVVRSTSTVRQYIGFAGVTEQLDYGAFTAVSTATIDLAIAPVFVEESVYSKFGASVRKIMDEYFPEV